MVTMTTCSNLYILSIWYRRISWVCWLSIYASAAGTSVNTPVRRVIFSGIQWIIDLLCIVQF